MPKTEITQADLYGFTGTEAYHKVSAFCPSLVATDGWVWLAKEAEAFWVFDVVASYFGKLRKESFQLWAIKLDGKGGCRITCRRDTNEKPLVSQEIPYTTWPEGLDNFEWYVEDGAVPDNDSPSGYKEIKVMMLKNER